MRGYDYLVVGAGLFGSTFTHEAVLAGKRVLVVDRRNHVGGNCWSHCDAGVEVHDYGPHFIHTNDSEMWEWFGNFATLIPSVPAPVSMWRGQMYSLPFSMYLFNQLWGVATPAEARAVIEEQRVPCKNPGNLEEHVLAMVGRDIYETLVKGYTEKQYGKPCCELPASLISRMPLLFEWSTNYNGKTYQGVPAEGYGPLFESLLDGAEVRLGVDYLEERESLSRLAREIVFSGAIDEYYNYRFGALEWRGRRFESETRASADSQGAALINYQDLNEPALRSLEHSLFVPPTARRPLSETIITREYAIAWKPGDEPFYTVNDETNQARYERYKELAGAEIGVHFGGRLGGYCYNTMEDTVRAGLGLAGELLG